MSVIFCAAFSYAPLQSREPRIAALCTTMFELRNSISPIVSLRGTAGTGVSDHLLDVLSTSPTFYLTRRFHFCCGSIDSLELLISTLQKQPLAQAHFLKITQRSGPRASTTTSSIFSSSSPSSVAASPISSSSSSSSASTSTSSPAAAVTSSSSPSSASASSSSSSSFSSQQGQQQQQQQQQRVASPNQPGMPDFRKTVPMDVENHLRPILLSCGSFLVLETLILSYVPNNFTSVDAIFTLLKDGPPRLKKTLRVLDLAGNQIKGNPDFSILREAAPLLEELHIQRNHLGTSTASPDFSCLPPYLQILNATSNRLTGQPKNLEKIPDTLEILLLSENWFSVLPSLELEHHTCLQHLALDNNNFISPAPNIEPANLLLHLPPFLERLTLQRCELRGPCPDVRYLSDELKVIHLYGNSLQGTLDLSFSNTLSSLVSFNIENNELSLLKGFDCLRERAPNLRTLSLSRNKFSGPLPSLSQLPPKLEYLYLGNNQFSGGAKLDVPALINNNAQEEEGEEKKGEGEGESSSCSLIELHIQSNSLSGEIDLSPLARLKNLRHLNLSSNRLQHISAGSLKKLPSSLQKLNLSSNCIKSELDLSHLPESLQVCDLSQNEFYSSSSSSGNGNSLFTSLPQSLDTLYVNANLQLSGSPDMTKLPLSLKKMDVSKTDLEFTPEGLEKLPAQMILLSMSHGMKAKSIEKVPAEKLPAALRPREEEEEE